MARLHPELPFPEPAEIVCHHDQKGHTVIAVSDYAAAKAAGWKLTKGVTAEDQRRAEHEVSKEAKEAKAKSAAQAEAARILAEKDAADKEAADAAKFAAAVKAEAAKMVADELAKRQAADKNGDGKVSTAEGKAAGVPAGPVNPNARPQ